MMHASCKCGFLVLALFLTAAATRAQSTIPTETRNAALRYWMAFAEMQDPPAGKATADLLEKTAAGEIAWDESKLGPILDANSEAVHTMQRATKLPECDWGLEYNLGPRAPISYVARARVMARLNSLYGMRLAAKGDSQGATDAWLAGIRFSQHLAQGGSLLFSLVAKTALLSNFQALTQAARGGVLHEAQRAQVQAIARALPETGFDWAEALRFEESPLEIGVQQLAAASNPAEYYQALIGRAAPPSFTVPNAREIAAFHILMGSAEELLRLPPQKAEDKLKQLQESVKTLHPYFRETTPSFLRINDARLQVLSAREELLKALAAK
jgi:hypothetical protein